MKELEDYSWFPAIFRNFQLEFIGFVVARFSVYDAFINYIKSLSRPVLPMADLCSGSGEPAISIFKKSKCFSNLTLSDKFPNLTKLNDGNTGYEIRKTDVLEIEFQNGTCYTMFNAFHHFSDDEKLRITQNIQLSGSAAFIVEILEPTFICFLKILITTTIGSLFLTTFILPFSLKRLLFTYIIPINIFTTMYDGIISVVKSRSVKQYQTLFADQENTIKIIKLRSRLNTLIVIQIEPQ